MADKKRFLVSSDYYLLASFNVLLGDNKRKGKKRNASDRPDEWDDHPEFVLLSDFLSIFAFLPDIFSSSKL